MRTIKCTFSRVISAMLVFLLALTASAPAFATPSTGEGIEITIRNNTGLPAMTPDQFIVYQLFTGTPYREGAPVYKEDDDKIWNPTNWDNYTLADIEWGSSVGDVNNQKNLIKALCDLDTNTYSWLGDENPFKSLDADDPVSTAAEVAVLLVDKSNAFMQGFASWLLSKKDLETFTLTPVEGENQANLEGTVKGSADEPAKQTLTYIVPSAGYYLFAENLNTHNNHQNDAVSEYIFAVLGNQEIDLKASVPTVDKDIAITDLTDRKGDAAGVGDYVKFKLTGTLPKNFGDFDVYKYIFHDTLSKGLTFVNDNDHQLTISVYENQADADADNNGTVIPPTYGTEPSSENYDIKTSSEVTGTTLTITFSDLKKLKSDESQSINVTASSVIVVTYYAQVNKDAVILSTGNPNTVQLEYSNDPNHEGTGETNQIKVYVYAFGLELTKVGSDKDHTNGLSGAGFVLKNDSGDYATFVDQWVNEAGDDFLDTEDDTHTTKVRRLNGWVTGSTAEEAIDNYKKDKKQENKQALGGYLLESGLDGKIPYVYGLDAGTYTLQEVITPDGYNTMDDFKFRIVANIDENGKLQEVIYTSDSSTQEKVYSGTSSDSMVFKSGLLPDTLTNQKAPFLPFTGGIGTVIFYVIGAALIAGAVIYLVILTQKRKKAEKNA